VARRRGRRGRGRRLAAANDPAQAAAPWRRALNLGLRHSFWRGLEGGYRGGSWNLLDLGCLLRCRWLERRLAAADQPAQAAAPWRRALNLGLRHGFRRGLEGG
jgi:hypothetical protein